MRHAIVWDHLEKVWTLNTHDVPEESVVISYSENQSTQRGMPSPLSLKILAGYLKSCVDEDLDPWITPGHKEWIVDADKLKSRFEDLGTIEWLRGKIAVTPDFEEQKTSTQRDISLQRLGSPLSPWEDYRGRISFEIVPELVERDMILPGTPVEIRSSLKKFLLDFPDPRKVAFTIMRFAETKAHIEINEGIKEALSGHGITGIRADEKQYHDDLFYNVLTYMHGCGFGIAVFERIEEESFNPNISMEVGYMMALRKPVCILKDRTLKTLHADMVGMLYRAFDPLDARQSVYEQITPWLRDKGIV